MKILLLGKDGQVGWELQRSLAPLGDVIALGRNSTDFRADYTDPEALGATIRAIAPQVIVNAAAHTAVDQAEKEPQLARLLNAEAPAVLAREARTLDAWLIHYSSDYVFDGSGSTPWSEESATNPLSVYGRTKLEGEEAIRASGCRHLIFRTSWVHAARGSNFAKTILKRARERDRLTVVDDQIGSPTGADLLADLTAHAIRWARNKPQVGGTYHAVAQGVTSWHGYARHVIGFARAQGEQLTVGDDAIDAVPSTAFPTPATRPHNSRMDTRKLRETFDLALPSWQSGVERMLAEVLNKN